MDKIMNVNSMTLEEKIDVYKKQMNSKELKALEIAINHLQSSFSIEKSIGFITYIDKLKKEQEQIN